MSYEFHKEEYKGCTIRIVQDEHREDPRKDYDHIGDLTPYDDRAYENQPQGFRHWDSEKERTALMWKLSERQRKIREALVGKPFTEPGTFVCDIDGVPDPDLALPEPTFDELIEMALIDHVIIPYKWDRGSYSKSFYESDDWNECSGYAHMALDTALQNWTGTDNEVRKQAEACLRAELEELNNWAQGNVAGWIAEDPDGNQIESVWGYYPDEYPKEWDYPIGEARDAIDHWHKEQHELATQLCMNI
jgi:hypothetical protein